MFYKYFIIRIGILILMNDFQQSSTQINCWYNQSNNCMIEIQLLTNFNGHKNNDQLQMNCSTEVSRETFIGENSSYLVEQRAILNGCQTTFDYDCCGLELIPNCKAITEMLVQYFQMNVLRIKQCQKELNLEWKSMLNRIQFYNNDIGGIDMESFSQEFLDLQELEFQSNSLYYIMPLSFKSLQFLHTLKITNELELIIKDEDFLFNIYAIKIHLESLKLFSVKILQKLPKMLQELLLRNTTLDEVEIHFINNGNLHNLSINNCGIEIFHLNDPAMSLEFLNIQQNKLQDFHIVTKCNVKILDLSENHLIGISKKWFKHLTNLKELILQKNLLKVFDLYDVLTNLPHINIIDIRQNDINFLNNIDNNYDPIQLSQVHIKCSKNPWSCSWLYKFAQKYPDKFRVMTYEKFIRKINVNGLECQLINENILNTSLSIDTNNSYQTNVIKSNDKNFNIMLYGDQSFEMKRNQRAEALIILFMLPMGIALLFLLLYMWIYCQKIFHLSYYRRKPDSKINAEANTSEEVCCNNYMSQQFISNSMKKSNSFHKYKDYGETINCVKAVCRCQETLNVQCFLEE